MGAKHVGLHEVEPELSPLPPVTGKKMPRGVKAEHALRAVLAMVSSTCPMLVHLPEYGFGLEETRLLLSAYAGHRLDIPPKKVLAKAWESMQAWLEVSQRLERGESEEDAVLAVSKRLGVTEHRVREAVEEFQRHVRAVAK